MKQKILLLVIIVLNVNCLVYAQSNKRDKIKEVIILMHQDTFSIKKFEDISRSSSTTDSEYFNDSTTLKVLSSYIKDSSLLNDMKAMLKDTAYLSLIGTIKDIYASKQKVNVEKIKEMAIKFVNEDLVDIYDRKFSVDEIEEMIRFYKTSAGQKLLSLMPEIQKEINKRIEEKYVTYIQSI